MQKHTTPTYKPPKQLEEQLQQQQHQQQPEGGQRRRTAVLPKRNWIQRNPRLFQISFITGSLLVLFSKPLYDAFFAEPYILPAEFRADHPPRGKRI